MRAALLGLAIGAWQQQQPAARSNAAATYDADRRQVLMFGGGTAELWAFDGTRWLLASRDGPAARDDAIMVYDTRRRRAVLTGGRSFTSGGPVIRNDTWEWDGGRWQLRDEQGFGQRLHAAGAFDARRGVTVVFGGVGEQDRMRTDTWEWDGARWALRDTTGPASAAPHGMAFDAARGRVQLLISDLAAPLGGGRFASRLLEWDGSRWSPRPGTPPPLSPTQRLISAGSRGGLLLFDGDPASGELSQTWAYDGARWVLTTGRNPARRFGPALAYDSQRNVAVLFGGHRAQADLDDTWELRPDGWARP